MSVTRISQPIAGEHVLAVHPPMAPTVDAAWRRRLRPYTGRALSDSALRAEQDNRAGHIVTLAATLSPGVVRGLGVTLEWPTSPGGEAFVHVEPGSGLLPSGEDVVVPRALRVSLRHLLPAGDVTALRAAILVLEPVELLALGRTDPNDPCEIDEGAIAFADEQRIDGALLRLLPWQDAWSGGPLDDASAQRNSLAYAIFEHERTFLPGDVQPWDHSGVPLALIGFRGGQPDYIDRFAVMRTGGRGRPRTPVVSTPGLRQGSPMLWQARVQQLVAHLQDLALEGTPVGDWCARLRWLPPAGLLPLSAMDVAARRNDFFPSSFSLRVAPLPLEQLDWLLDRCAGLAPLDTRAPEQVLVIAPVPQAVYEPGLLLQEAVAPEFAAAVARLRTVREETRARREHVRQCHTALVETIEGPLVTAPGAAPVGPAVTPRYDDTGALETEPAVTPSAGTESAFDVITDAAPTPAGAVRRPRAWIELRTRVAAHAFLSAQEKSSFGLSGLVGFMQSLQTKIDAADDAVDFSFLKAHTDIYRVRQLMLGSAVASRLLTSPALATIVKAETAVAQREEVNRFYQSIKGKTPLGGIEPPVATTIAAPGGTTGESGGVIGLAGVPTTGEASAGTPLVGMLSLGTTGFFAGSTSRLAMTAESALSAAAMAGSVEGRAREVLFIAPERAREDIQNAEPIIGEGGYDFRTISIAKRLDTPPATEARAYSAANRYEAITALESVAQSGLNLDDVMVQGVAESGKFDDDGSPTRKAMSFAQLREAGFGTLLNDPSPLNPVDDGAYMLESVRLLEHNIATLRAVEGRIANYRAVLADCTRVLAVLRADLERASSRLAVLDDQVSDARHRVSTALALQADETRRVQTVNDRRREVISRHVHVLAYVRPRSVEAIVDAPAVALDSGLLPPAVPACLADHDDPPAELERMLQLFREAPVAWFRHVPRAIEKLDRVELLHGTIASAQVRARALIGSASGAPGGLLTFGVQVTLSAIGKRIAGVIDSQRARVAERRAKVAQLDASRFAGLGWRESRDQAIDVLTLGDLIESNHGRRVVAGAALRELEQIGRIAACLYAQVGEVAPVIRLAWAELLGQHDEGVALGNLTALPRFGEIPFADRKDMQELADWLYERVDPKEPDALALMHDLVRVCILLASHAPVDEIVAGHVAVDASASPGAAVPVAIDPVRVRLGMRAMFFMGQELVAHGVVDDLTGTRARTRVVETRAGAAVSLPKDAKVRFVAPDKFLLPTSFGRAR